MKFFKLRHIVSVLVIVTLSAMVTYTNLGMTKAFIGDDAGMGNHFLDSKIDSVKYMWDSSSFPGRPNVIASTALIHILSLYSLNYLGVSSILLDRLAYFLFFFFSGIGMYCLSNYLLSSHFTSTKPVTSWLASISSAIFYIFNNYTMVLLSFPITNYVYSYVFLPWIFLLYLKNYHVSSKFHKKISIAILSLIIISGNPSNTISIFAALLLYEIFFRTDYKIIHNLKQFCTTVIIFILFSSYIFLPVLGNQANPYGKISNADNTLSFMFSSANTTLDNLFKFRGHPSQITFSFNDLLENKLVQFLNYLIVVLAFIPLFTKKQKRITVFCALVFVIGLFLSKANHEPFAAINYFIFEKVPLFGMYRAGWYKFLYFSVFAISLLIPISMVHIQSRLEGIMPQKLVSSLAILPLLTILFLGKPFFVGEVVRKIHKVEIPSEYVLAHESFSQIDGDFSILSLPYTSGLSLDWGNGNFYAGAPLPDVILFGKPVWSDTAFFQKQNTNDSLAEYTKILDHTNTKYLVLHKDIPESYEFAGGISGTLNGQSKYSKIKSDISNDHNFSLKENNKFFEIYEVNKNLYLPHLYINRNQNNLSSIVSVNKINPTKLQVVINTDDTTQLISIDAFNKGWKLYGGYLSDPFRNGNPLNIITDKQVSSSHFVYDTFQNGWDVDPQYVCNISPKSCEKKDDGSYNISLIIEYWPQRLYYIGRAISFTVFILLLSFMVSKEVIRILRRRMVT